MAKSIVDTDQEEFLGHPKGLFVLAATEMWERFSYYGMRALLIFYLTQHFLFEDEKATIIFGAYASTIYLLPVLGGALADRFLGSRKAVIFGALLLVAGHLGMALEGPAATFAGSEVLRSDTHVQILFLSLALIAVGVGFLKGNISTMVGALYDLSDSRRDSGFTIFYVGINVGAAVAALACGYLGQTWGWRWGFGLAGVGMIFGLAVFLLGQRYLADAAEPPDPDRLRERPFAGITLEIWLYIAGLAVVAIVWMLLQHPLIVGRLLGTVSAFLGGFFVWYGTQKCSPDERMRLLALLVLIVFTVVFWALAAQSGSSLGLLISRVVDRELLGSTIPPSMFQSLPAILVIVMGTAFVALWQWLARRGLEPNTPVKFAIGIGFMGGSFITLAAVLSTGAGDAKIAMGWIVLLYVMQTVGELCISPVGLSVVTKMAPSRIAGLMMGAWFLADSAAEFVGGLIARMTSVKTVPGENIDVEIAKHAYAGVYFDIGVIAMIGAALLLFLSPWLRGWMHDPAEEAAKRQRQSRKVAAPNEV